jgi:hypothetical protein
MEVTSPKALSGVSGGSPYWIGVVLLVVLSFGRAGWSGVRAIIVLTPKTLLSVIEPKRE